MESSEPDEGGTFKVLILGFICGCFMISVFYIPLFIRSGSVNNQPDDYTFSYADDHGEYNDADVDGIQMAIPVEKQKVMIVKVAKAV